MNKPAFSEAARGATMKVELVSFENSKDLLGFTMTAEIERRQEILSIQFEICGNIKEILFPKTNATPGRKNSLWEHTCMEMFFSFENQTFYWELNASPSGDWNIYSFNDYRDGQREEMRISEVSQEVLESSEKKWIQRISLDLSRVMDQTRPIEISVTAVIEKLDQSKSYWAVEHLGAKPDFHLRKSMSLKIH